MAEFRSLAQVYHQYSDRVELVSIGIDPFESLADLETFRERYGYTWLVTKPSSGFFSDYNIVTQATKVAVDTGGVIIWRKGYSTTDTYTWHKMFQDLTS